MVAKPGNNPRLTIISRASDSQPVHSMEVRAPTSVQELPHQEARHQLLPQGQFQRAQILLKQISFPRRSHRSRQVPRPNTFRRLRFFPSNFLYKRQRLLPRLVGQLPNGPLLRLQQRSGGGRRPELRRRRARTALPAPPDLHPEQEAVQLDRHLGAAERASHPFP